jgi:hypothetical protein
MTLSHVKNFGVFLPKLLANSLIYLQIWALRGHSTSNNVPCRLGFNSFTAKSVLAGEKTCSYVLNFYVGIVHYILRETKTRHAKIYLPTQRTNWRILTSEKRCNFDPLLMSSMQQAL